MINRQYVFNIHVAGFPFVTLVESGLLHCFLKRDLGDPVRQQDLVISRIHHRRIRPDFAGLVSTLRRDLAFFMHLRFHVNRFSVRISKGWKNTAPRYDAVSA
jgi:hypothetical protein